MQTAGLCLSFLIMISADDQLSGWAPILSQFEEKYRIVCLCLPFYDKQSASSQQRPNLLYKFPTLVSSLHAAICRFSSGAPFTMVVHDWGAYLGYLFENAYPAEVRCLIAFDVGISSLPAAYELFVLVLYQWWIAFAFVTAKVLGLWIGNMCSIST